MGKVRVREQVLPNARKEGLVIKELADEWLVYDLDIHKAHVLNEAAAQVWKHCDGRTTVSQLATLLETNGAVRLDDELIWLAVEQLGKAKLLDKQLEKRAALKQVSRREVIRKLGAAAAVPLVVSMIAPNASAAVSCAGRDCTGNPSICGASCTCDTGLNVCVG